MKKTTIITHNGPYHSDDLLAVAALSLFLAPSPLEIVRTRDESIIKKGDYVVDVGGVYDEARRRFDHHQSEGAGERANGIPYASFGLVWKFCGEKLCGSKEVAEIVDRKLVAPIDANDNGVELSEHKLADSKFPEYKFPEISPYLVQDFFRAFAPTWKEKENISTDSVFSDLLKTARLLLEREIKRATDAEESKKFVEDAYKNSPDKRLVILEREWPWREVIGKYEEPLFVVRPSDDRWGVTAVPEKIHSFKNRKNLPAEWAGKRDRELAEITGVPDAVFCTRQLFAAYARSKEGALALAKLALAGLALEA